MASSSRSKMDRNREKLIQDRLQLLLTKMLQDEDNKYCVDCDSKGPRWVSWNLGIFLCIKCAGIHRNLGVHISKVKSVNLDSWTPQQVASMQVMGNSKARAVYEARLPDDFRRPRENDSALEQFIRAKYERKKYIAREWTPTKPPDLPIGWAEIIEAEKQKKDIRSIKLPSLNSSLSSPEHTAATVASTAEKTSVPAAKETATSKNSAVLNTKATPTASPASVAKAAAAPPSSTNNSSASFDLLGLTTSPVSTGAGAATKATPTQAVPPTTTTKLSNDLDLLCLGSGTGNGSRSSENNDNDFDDFVGVSATPTSSSASNNQTSASGTELNLFANNNAVNKTGSSNGGSQMSKDSIMALFNKPPAQSTAAVSAAVPAVPAAASNPLANLLPGLQAQPQQQAAGFPAGPSRMNQPAASAGFAAFSSNQPGLLNQQLNQLGLNPSQVSQPPAAAAASMMMAASNPSQTNMLNNPFMANTGGSLGFGAMNGGATSNGGHANKQSWGFN